MRVRRIGDPERWLSGAATVGECQTVEFSAGTMGLGLGAFGLQDLCLGEFLAAGGAAVNQPANGTHKPDYLLHQGALVPTVQVCVRHGRPRRFRAVTALRQERPRPAACP